MKNIIIIFLTSITVSLGQSNSIDLLKKHLETTLPDTDRVMLLSELCFRYRLSKPDSALQLGKQALELSKNIKFLRGQSNTFSSIGFVYRGLGELQKAMEFQFLSLEIAQKNFYVVETGKSLFGIGAVYLDLKNYPKSLSYYHLARKQFESIDSRPWVAHIKVNLADTYEQMGRLDSAHYFAQLGYLNMTKLQFQEIPYALRVLGNVYTKMNKTDLALASYKLGVRMAQNEQDDRNTGACYYLMAELFRQNHQLDSCIYYAEKGFVYAQRCNYRLIVLSSSNLLADMYETKNLKEAIRYHRIAMKAREDLYSAKKFQSLQNVIIEDDERRKQIRSEQEQYQSLVKNFVLIACILISILIAFFFYRNRLLLRQNTELLSAILEGQTTERKRVAADLHDNLSSTLTAIRWNLMAFNQSNLTGTEKKVYDDLLTMTTSAHDQVRLISHNLLPEQLEKEGLTKALEGLIRKMNHSGKIHFTLNVSDIANRLGKKEEFELYSIILELTQNIMKHSDGSEAKISLSQTEHRVLLKVSDNGIGLPERRHAGIGMQNIANRVKSLNGKWQIISVHGEGVVFEGEFG